jgi:ABC-type cobalamin/Fe3+-siderophores transport system ATPase subunit
MAGASFVRADLHVHSRSDVPDEAPHEPADYLTEAVQRGVKVLGITDHNAIDRVADFMVEAAQHDLLVLPGIEITTHQGHLLALFSPGELDALANFAAPANLRLSEDPLDKSVRSDRSLLDLVGDIHREGGLAIPAHVDAKDGIGERLARTELVQLLSYEGLAGLEFATKEALESWFSDDDENEDRREAWLARRKDPELRARGLARVMSSDAHSPDKVGQDRTARTITRLRLDDPTFTAVRNALVFNPKARCKPEVLLPVNYPRVLSATYEGGFLDGVTIDFSSNLTCLIGGRGSGKSTALLALRAALGARIGVDDDDPDEPGRMPERTTVKFVDRLGSERTVVRVRGNAPEEVGTGVEVDLLLADLGQDESGRLARGYEDEPEALLGFLDKFVDLEAELEREEELLAQLAENSNEVTATALRPDQIQKLDAERKGLEASLAAAQKGRIDEIAQWATLLASQKPFLDRLLGILSEATKAPGATARIDVDAIAAETGVRLDDQLAKQFLEGDDGLRAKLKQLETEIAAARTDLTDRLSSASEDVHLTLQAWKVRHDELQQRLGAKQKELEALGLKVEAGEALRIANRLNTVRVELIRLRDLEQRHRVARATRDTLLTQLMANRDAIFEKRKASLRRVVDDANAMSDGLRIHVHFEQASLRDVWRRWLTQAFGFRSPRVERLAARLSPQNLAELIVKGRDALAQLRVDGEQFFDDQVLNERFKTIAQWSTVFELETMLLEELPRIEVQEPGSPTRRDFSQLSAGQQRSVLLSLMLCATRSEPLVLDQPEDHLDAEYIAHAVVRHLDAAKERRQVILATHSANLTVLGDAELVIPLYAEDQHGRPRDPGAVDRLATRDRVCDLLEGGAEAYRRRGLRYGFRIETTRD